MSDKTTQIKDRFLKYNDWEDRYKELIQLGRHLAPYPEEKRDEKFKVKGCQSQVWLYPEFKDGIVNFYADSDALLVKGIVGLLVSVYSNSTPDEILSTRPDFLKEVGITEHLSMNRTNGLSAMMKQIQMYALVYKSMQKVEHDSKPTP
ncbi:MAG TPA: SufE family protein [Bacteriovoracaceae bacterium]|nr:SufE family protein [Bacteriovoracaceae bacterium]